jgi:hypothetical protein
MGFEPMNTGFADQRVSHFAIGASRATTNFAASNSILALRPALDPAQIKNPPGCLALGGSLVRDAGYFHSLRDTSDNLRRNSSGSRVSSRWAS